MYDHEAIICLSFFFLLFSVVQSLGDERNLRAFVNFEFVSNEKPPENLPVLINRFLRRSLDSYAGFLGGCGLFVGSWAVFPLELLAVRWLFLGGALLMLPGMLESFTKPASSTLSRPIYVKRRTLLVGEVGQERRVEVVFFITTRIALTVLGFVSISLSLLLHWINSAA